MKRYLLSLLIVPLLLIGGYSSAGLEASSNFTYSNTAQRIYLFGGIEYIKVVDIVQGGSSNIQLTCQGLVYKPALSVGDELSIPDTFDSSKCYVQPGGSNSVTLFIKYVSPYVSDSDLNTVIIGLTNSINEFIPYVVYIGLGVLGVLIGFVAIKRLINWVRAKIFSSFK